MIGTFELQLYDEADDEYLIEVEFNVFGRYDPGDYMTPPSEPEVEFTLIDPIPRCVGLSKSEVLHLAADLFWERDMLNDYHRDQEDYYSGW